MINLYFLSPLWLKKSLLFLFIFSFLSYNVTKAQTAISAATSMYVTSTHDSTYVAKGAPGSTFSGNTYTYNYGTLSGTTSNSQEVTNFTAGAITYSFKSINNQVVKMRRVNNAVVSGTRNLKWTQGALTGSTLNMNDSYDGDMESFFIGNNHFNSGTDNIFGNQGDGNGNNNDIERVDVIFPNGFSATDNSKAGFAVFERGVTAGHDSVKVAAILGLDGSGMPNRYSSIIKIVAASYGATDVVAARNYIIIRRDTATEPFKISTQTSQAIGGVFFKYSDFGIANNTPIYGYSLIPPDFPNAGTPPDLIDYTNAIYFPTNTSSNGAGGIDPVAFTGISQSAPVVNSFFPISGNVYDDANGLQDGTVNGTGTNAGNTLFAQLVNSGNIVIATVAVNSNSTYTFPAEPPGTYGIVLNTSSTTSSVASLPAGYVNTGENLGAGMGSDGTANGIIANIVITSANVTNVNFGIDHLPVSDNKTFTIATPGVNNTLTLDGTGPAPSPLSGSDVEDGILGTNDSVIITSVPINAELYYNGTLLSNNSTIGNYDPTKLQIKFTTLGSMNTSFQYSFMDAAGYKSSIAATYSIMWTGALPVVLTSFTAIKVNNEPVLKWTTSGELNTNNFNIERSTDNEMTWQTIGTINTAGTTSTTQNYSFTDANAANGTDLYRLKIVDKTGYYQYSIVKQIELVRGPAITLYPNPIVKGEEVKLLLSGFYKGKYQVNVVSESGQLLLTRSISIVDGSGIIFSITGIGLSPGTNAIIVEGNGVKISNKVTILEK